MCQLGHFGAGDRSGGAERTWRHEHASVIDRLAEAETWRLGAARDRAICDPIGFASTDEATTLQWGHDGSAVAGLRFAPDANEEDRMDLHELLDRRRTIREFASTPVHESDLVHMLWAAQGITSDGRRTTPSAAGRYPLRFVVARGPEPPGTWTWDPDGGVLMPKTEHDVRARLSAAAIGEQPWIATGPVTVVVCADMHNMVSHFADQPPPGRGCRYVDIEAGAAAQNLALSATERGLAGVIVGGFDDAAVAEVVDLGPLEPRLLFSLGHPA